MTTISVGENKNELQVKFEFFLNLKIVIFTLNYIMSTFIF